jgi:multicomponent Na+:H+ antiporter subunit D
VPQSEYLISSLPVFIILAPILGAACTMLADRYRPALRSAAILSGVLVPLLLVVYMFNLLKDNTILYLNLNVLPPAGMEFRVDALALYMVLLFAFFALVITVYTLGYYRDKAEGKPFFYFLLLAIGGCFGVALSGNMFTFFLFFEFMSLMFFPMVAYKSTPEAYAAGLKFFFMTIIAGVAMFWAIVITTIFAGTTSFGAGGLFESSSPFIFSAFIGYLVAFGIKSAIIPLHFWMPDAYASAPTPAATISSAIMLKTGVLGLIRVIHDIYGLSFIQEVGWNNILLVFALVGMLYGSICAFAQDDLNRRLAYSGIAQVGYMMLGIAMLTELALIGALYHVMAHAFMKSCMFLCAGVIYVNTGKTKISEMRGVGLQMPITMLAFTIASVSAVGVPPFNLFVSKWHLGLGAYQAGMPWIIIILLLSSILNAAYYFPISINAFLGCRELKNIERQRLRLQPLRMIPVMVLALGAFVFTIMPFNWPLDLVRNIAQLFF